MVEFKKFKVSELFDYKRGKESAPKKVPEGDIPLISETSSNNGFVRGASSTHVFPAKTITVSVNYAQTVFLQPKEFCASVNIIVLVPKFSNASDAVLLYFVALLRANNGVYDYNYKISKDRLMNTVLLVPVTPAGEPDFEYMTMRIRELEAERIRELEAYLHVTGLDDTTLSASEAQALTQKVRWKKFKVGDYFDIEKVRGVNKSGLTSPTDDESYDYITRTSQNNGIESITGKVSNRELNEAGSISLGLLQMTFFYRDRQWYAGQFVRKIVPKVQLTKEQTLYFVTLFNALRPKLIDMLVRNVDNVFLNTEVELPVASDDQIDFNYMQNYIRATEKQTIKGVVEYKDRVIKETKKVVGE